KFRGKDIGYKSYQVRNISGQHTRRYANIIRWNDKVVVTDNKLWFFDIDNYEIHNIDGKSYRIGDYYIGHAKYIFNNKIYVGTATGFMTIDPQPLVNMDTIRKIWVTDIKVNNQSLKLNKDYAELVDFGNNRYVLARNQNNLIIEYSNLPASRYIYKTIYYRLKGYDDNWQTTSDQYIRYNNLHSGKYELLLTYSPLNNIDSKEISKIQFVIKPPIFTSWQFIASVIGVAIMVLIIIYWYARKWYKVKHQLSVTKEVNRLKLQFFTNITHELRTPLSLIISPAEELLKLDTDPSIKANLELINNSSRRLLTIVNELLDYRKSDIEDFHLTVSNHDLNKITKELVSNFKNYSKQKDIKFDISLTKDEIPLWIDHEKFSKILFNLVSNAIKYTDEGGHINTQVISNAENAKIPWKNNTLLIKHDEVANEYAGISIRDNGIGITKESLPKIFERFYQVEDTNNKHLGSGVGLAIAKNLVLQMKGQLLVSSNRGEGTYFLLKIPKGDAYLTSRDVKLKQIEKSSETLQTSKEVIPNGKMKHDKQQFTILLVEDNNELRNYVAESLANEFNIVQAKDGKEGFEMVYKVMPDIIITDVMMPGMTGFDLCRRVKKDITVSHIPVVLLTAKSSEKNITEGFELGADGYISKPFSLDVLRAKLHSLLQNVELLKERFQQKGLVNVNTKDVSGNEKKFLDKITGIIKEKLEDPSFSVEDLCKELNMTTRNLQLKIKSLTGITPHHIIRTVRLEYAADMLKTSDERISDIAYKCGFVSPAHFGKCFKEKYKVTPKEYKIRNK
ncbi:MAG: response regulator, partial [Bacteroidales bacterium]|nr:response regulator [Bacteroidales bacterium]